MSECAGIQVSGYWKGYPCGAITKYHHDGKDYCHTHLAIALTDPDRFKRVAEQVERSSKRKKKND